MRFDLSDAQKALRDTVRHDLAEHAKHFADSAGAASRDALRRHFASHGWLGAGLPPERGGGRDIVDLAIIARECGRQLIFGSDLLATALVSQTIVACEERASGARNLRELVAGERILSLAYGEPQSRGMPDPIATRAEGANDDLSLFGLKSLVIGGTEVDGYVVSAISGEETVLVLVDAKAAGLSRTQVRLHDGTLACHIELDGVLVNADDVLSRGAGAMAALRAGIARGIAVLCSELIGMLENTIETTAAYLKGRIQFGVPLSSFQALQHRLADMAAELELARSSLLGLLSAIGHSDEETINYRASQTKSLVGRAAKQICGEAIQLHGAVAMVEDSAIGRAYKKSLVSDILLGGSNGHDAQRAEELQRRLSTDELRWLELLPLWWMP